MKSYNLKSIILGLLFILPTSTWAFRGPSEITELSDTDSLSTLFEEVEISIEPSGYFAYSDESSDFVSRDQLNCQEVSIQEPLRYLRELNEYVPENSALKRGAHYEFLTLLGRGKVERCEIEIVSRYYSGTYTSFENLATGYRIQFELSFER